MKLLLPLVCMLLSHTTAAVGSERANVLILISDDQMLPSLGCAGNPVIKTPHLDRLAGDGVLFTRCFSPNPICTPSRACILTGQDSWINGCVFFGEPIRESSPMWPRLLSQAGYETFFTGKWHNDGQPSTRCIRTERYKLIQHLLTGEVELFDLATDPLELENLAGQPDHAGLQEQLTEKLMAWRRQAPGR